MASKVAVVILNWNGKQLLSRYLDSVIRYSQLSSGSVEIVVADNGSTDGSLEWVRQEVNETVRCLDLGANHGFAKGYNLALSQIESQYAILLNSDVEVTAGWLDPLIEYLDAHPQVVACQPKIRSLKQRTFFEHAGACGGFIDRLGYPFCRGRIMEQVEEDNGQYEDVMPVFWASGACLCMRLAAFHEAGGLDEAFFAHMEEIDLCWRWQSRGRQIVCIPQSLVYHVGGATLPVGNPQKTYLNFRNNNWMLYKNLPASQLLPVMAGRCLLDYLSALMFLLTGHAADAWAVVKARCHVWTRLGRLRPMRQENRRQTVTDRLPTIYPGSLIVDYYIRGIRRFSQLKWPSRASHGGSIS
jgi:GT2 family glycosyltransferase